MRRRLQGIEHTDCTARGISGRRNRYALAAPMVTGTPAANKSVYSNPQLYRGGSFIVVVFGLGAEHPDSSHGYWFSRVFHGGSAPVFESIDHIVVYNLSQNLSTPGGPAAQFGAAECGSASAQRGSISRLFGNSGSFIAYKSGAPNR